LAAVNSNAFEAQTAKPYGFALVPYVPSNPQHVGCRTHRKESQVLLLHGPDSTKGAAVLRLFYGDEM
jgi:hypothetical protein